MATSDTESSILHAPLTTPNVFAAPIVFDPLLEHRQTFIILHGRGSYAAKFGPPLLATTTPQNETNQTAFPHARIIFPTASRNRATIYKGSYTHQCFNNWHLEEHTKRQDLLGKGLNKSCIYIHDILKEEIGIVGKENIVLWGLSQGCSTSLASLLTWDGEPFGAVVGMCDWLPFPNVVEKIAKGYDDAQKEDDENNPFAVSEKDNPFSLSGYEGEDAEYSTSLSGGLNARNTTKEALKFFREELGMIDKTGIVYRDVLIFLGHGVEDARVGIELGRGAKCCLESIGADVQMVDYKSLGHWYSEQMLQDIFGFLKEKPGLKTV